MSKRTGGKPQLKAKKLTWRAKRRLRFKALVTGYQPPHDTNKFLPKRVPA